MNPPKTILVATDFSAAAEVAFDYAIALAGALGARVYLMHAYQLPIGLGGLPVGPPMPSVDIAARIVADAKTQLAACLERHPHPGVEVIPLLEHADPREAVLDAAKRELADLIMMGTHGRRGIRRALIGSVAEAVVRASPVPVVTLRAPALEG